jgi:hypothetical protein
MARYYDRVTKTERFAEALPDIKELPPENVFWSALPPGMQLTYDGSNFPNGLEAIPAPIYTAEEQARIDLQAAGVTTNAIVAAMYMFHRGDSALVVLANNAIDAVVISSGLTLAQVSELV